MCTLNVHVAGGLGHAVLQAHGNLLGMHGPIPINSLTHGFRVRYRNYYTYLLNPCVNLFVYLRGCMCIVVSFLWSGVNISSQEGVYL